MGTAGDGPGAAPRPAAQWVRSLDVLRAFPAAALARSHGRSVVGADASRDHLRNDRDVIARTHDRTVRRMNQGYVPDQIVERLDMPPHLRGYETTGIEGYGSVLDGDGPAAGLVGWLPHAASMAGTAMASVTPATVVRMDFSRRALSPLGQG